MPPAEWSPQTSYPRGARVTLEGKTYEAKEPNQRIAPDSPRSRDEGTWQELAEHGYENAT